MTPALQAVNQRFGTDYTLQHYVHPDARHWMPSDHHDHFMEFVRDPEVYGHLAALPGSIEAVLDLAAHDCNIVITSHRPPAALQPTRDWLLRHGVAYAQLEVDFGSKAALATRYGPDRPLIFLDDDPTLIKILALPRPGIEVWLLQTPYTGQVDLSLCRLFADWPQLQAALLERLQPSAPEL
jgi:hypothetical protein